MTVPCDEEDRVLFQASTKIKLGNGEKATFWHHKGLNCIVLKNIAPNLYKRVHFKKRVVAKELLNNN
jgi:hypothetical protein